MCLWEQEPKARSFEFGGKEVPTYDLIGRILMDYMELYKKYNFEERHSYALNAIAEVELNDHKVDYEGTLDELYSNTFYNTVRRSPYEQATGYLDGLVVTTESYTTLMARYKDQPKTLFLLDPPYLYTGQGAYNQEKYFAMVDFLYLMSLTRPPYIFFSSTKSELMDYLDYLKQLNNDDWQRLGGFERVTIQAHVNHERAYEDNMIYRF